MFSVLLFLKLRKWTIGISWIFFCSWIAVQSLVGLFFKKRFSYLYMAVLDLPCCLRTLSCSRQGLLFIGVCVLLIVVAFLVVEQGFCTAAYGLSCSAAYGIFVPLPGMESMSPALAGEFLTTRSLGKLQTLIFMG